MINQTMRVFVVFLCVVTHRLANADSLPIADLPEDRIVVFSRDVAPVLKRNCVACHNASNEEGGVNLESDHLSSIAKMESSDAGNVLVPGKPAESLLFQLASHVDDPVMPPDDNDVSASALKPIELALLKRWIQSGAIVDQVTTDSTGKAWQPLPPTIKTVFGSAMTPDGRLSAVSFGNQIRLFGVKSSRSIGSLEIASGSQTKSAHDDFVQDLAMTPDGRQVISAGYRNVKRWEMAPFEPALMPEIDHDSSLVIAMNASGSHVAVLSRRGELSVAEIGKERWQWMKGFDTPDDFTADPGPKIHLAVGELGQRAAIAWGHQVYVLSIDGIEPQRIELAEPVTAIEWQSEGQMVTGDSRGQVTFWKREQDAWEKSEHGVFDHAMLGLYPAGLNTKRLIAIDVTGDIARWNDANESFEKLGKLPSPAVSASLTPNGSMLWAITAKGALGRYSIADKRFTEVAKSDPVTEARLAADKWQTLVGEMLAVVHEKDVKQAEANVTAEQKSLERFGEEIESKTKQRDGKQIALIEAKKTSETLAKKLVETKEVQQTRNRERADLTESLKKLDTKILEVEKQLAGHKAKHADVKKKLAAVPESKKLADAVKAATDASNKADQVTETKISELAEAVAALRRAEETKIRGETRLKGLKLESERQRRELAQVKEDQKRRVAKRAASQKQHEQSQAAGETLAVMSAGNRIITGASNTRGRSFGNFSLWSGSGDWLVELSGMPVEGQLIDAGDKCVLIKTANGNTRALRASERLWRHRQTVGSSIGPSPFSDRVLSVDVDPTGRYFATGGGEPSRSGELMIWRISDGSLVRAIEKSHQDTVLCVRFSPDGKTLATAGADRMVKLWEVESGELIKTLEGHTHHVTSIAWNVNRRQLASGSADETVKIWDVDSGQATRTISGIKTEVTGLDYVGRDNRISAVGGDGHFRVYRTDNGARETSVKVPGGYLYTLDSNRDGSQFVTGGADGVAVLVDKTGKQTSEYTSDNN